MCCSLWKNVAYQVLEKAKWLMRGALVSFVSLTPASAPCFLRFIYAYVGPRFSWFRVRLRSRRFSSGSSTHKFSALPSGFLCFLYACVGCGFLSFRFRPWRSCLLLASLKACVVVGCSSFSLRLFRLRVFFVSLTPASAPSFLILFTPASAVGFLRLVYACFGFSSFTPASAARFLC